jgi:FkbM family methyltransferase
MILVPSDFVQGEIFWHGAYDRNTADWLSRTLTPESSFVDIGSHAGYFLLTAAGVVKKGRLFGFEPQQGLLDQCRRSIELNGISNVDLFGVALSAATGESTLHISDASNLGMTGLRKPPGDGGGTTIVKTALLDDFQSMIPVGKPLFVKIDVEGAELEVLKGMAGVIMDFKPMLFVELIEEQLARFGTSVKEAYEWLYGQGYKAFQIQSDGCLSAVKGFPESYNIVFRHP